MTGERSSSACRLCQRATPIDEIAVVDLQGSVLRQALYSSHSDSIGKVNNSVEHGLTGVLRCANGFCACSLCSTGLFNKNQSSIEVTMKTPGARKQVCSSKRSRCFGLAPGSNGLLRVAVFLAPLTACGQKERSDGDVMSSDGASSAATSSTAGSGTEHAASQAGGSSSVGSSGSSGATSAQATAESSTTGADVSATAGNSSAAEVSSTSDGASHPNPANDAGTTSEASVGDSDASAGSNEEDSMSFFVTSTGVEEGGNFGGLEGADAFCTQLAAAVSESLGNRIWRAYLSTSTVNARDRIGNGPWRNANGVVVANDVAALHAQEPGQALDRTWPPADLAIALTESGEQVPNSIHDILTGSLPDGTVDANRHCNDWTSSEATDEASVGHSNRDGGGRPPYFNATHQVGCAPSTTNYDDGTVTAGGGQGSIYCFALAD